MTTPATDPRLIVPLDQPGLAEARDLVSILGDRVSFYKVGLELFARGGMDLARDLKAQGKQVFLDWKLHDIGATVERAAAYLEALQNPDGGFRYLGAEGPSGAPRTAAAVFALLVAERTGATVDRGWAWLDAHPIVPGGGDGYALYGLSYEAAARWRRRQSAADPRWQAWHARTAGLLLAAQRPDGAWQDPSCAEYGTAAAVAVLCVPRGTTPLFEVERGEDGR